MVYSFFSDDYNITLLKKDGETEYDEDILESIESSGEPEKAEAQNDDKDDTDELLEDVIEMVIETGQASTSFIQRRFKVGYSRAGRIMDQLSDAGVVGPEIGTKPRKVLMSAEEFESYMSNN